MKRKIQAQLKIWKSSKNKKPLIIKGARQVGKTYAIRQFAKENYQNFIEINFEKNIEFVDLFNKTRNPKDILSYIELAFMDIDFNVSPLIFLDEIQACPNALTALKFLAEECPYDIVCSGSMLGVAIAASTSFPVGYVETWEMYPMTFQEFLYGVGVKEHMISKLYDCLETLTPLPSVIHDKFNDLFTQYIICGGMPEAVLTFSNTKSYKEVLKVQRRIVSDYINDMAKYAIGSDRIKAHECFSSVPLQLAKENKKFQYNVVKKGYNARYYDSSLRWLEDSGLIIKINRLKCIKLPLEAYSELPIFKVYMGDTGLLISQFDESVIKELLIGELGIYKGAIYENVGAQILKSSSKTAYYFEPHHNSEIDFIIYYEGSITPIEVKSGKQTSSVSFRNFVEEYKCQNSFRLSKKNLSENSQTIYLPYYLFPFLLEKEDKFI